MIDLWAQNVKTKECFRVTRDESRPIYIDENGNTIIDLNNVTNYRFYPCCPKDSPKNEVKGDFTQMEIYDFIGKG